MLPGGTGNPRAPDSARWDDAIARLDGDLLQSWRWGEFKQRHGWNVERIHVEQRRMARQSHSSCSAAVDPSRSDIFRVVR